MNPPLLLKHREYEVSSSSLFPYTNMVVTYLGTMLLGKQNLSTTEIDKKSLDNGVLPSNSYIPNCYDKSPKIYDMGHLL